MCRCSSICGSSAAHPAVLCLQLAVQQGCRAEQLRLQLVQLHVLAPQSPVQKVSQHCVFNCHLNLNICLPCPPIAGLLPPPLQPPFDSACAYCPHIQHYPPFPSPQAFYPRLYSRCQAEVFVAGNMARSAALGFAEQLEAQLRER